MIGNLIKFKPIDQVSKLSIPDIVECCAVEIVEHRIILVCIYRVPTNKDRKQNLENFFRILDDILHLIARTSKKVVLCGDLNINLLTKNKLLSLSN